MKVIVYLPALNESETIGAVLDGIPSRFPGIDSVRAIVIDDGSTDATSLIAQRHGAMVVRHPVNLGTGRTFVSGVSAALRAGADIIVSMDADGQFRGEDIGRLVAPILEGRADVALCSRFADGNMIGNMPLAKRLGRKGKRAKTKPKYQSKKNRALKWSGRGLTPLWMRGEMKGTKLKKDDFLIK